MVDYSESYKSSDSHPSEFLCDNNCDLEHIVDYSESDKLYETDPSEFLSDNYENQANDLSHINETQYDL